MSKPTSVETNLQDSEGTSETRVGMVSHQPLVLPEDPLVFSHCLGKTEVFFKAKLKTSRRKATAGLA